MKNIYYSLNLFNNFFGKFLLFRVHDIDLAQFLQETLSRARDTTICEFTYQEIVITMHGREGYVSLNEKELPMSLRSLPTVVETYEISENKHIIKVGDIGSIILVGQKVNMACLVNENGITSYMKKAIKHKDDCAHQNIKSIKKN